MYEMMKGYHTSADRHRSDVDVERRRQTHEEHRIVALKDVGKVEGGHGVGPCC